MENEIKRGDVYWLRMDAGIGSEQASGRPVVIVSNDEGNQTCPTVLAAYLTTKVKYGRINAPLYVRGKRSYVMCNQITTIDKSRLGDYWGSATDDELSEIDEALRVAFDLNYYDDEIENEDEEIEESDEIDYEEKCADLELELEIAKVKYDRLLEKYVELKIGTDLAVKTAPPAIIIPENKPPVEKPKPIDINRCSEKALREIGWEAQTAKNIVAKRPYKTLDEIKSVSGVTKKYTTIAEALL